MSSTDRSDQVGREVQAAVDRLGLVVEDITVTPAGRRRLVRILVDRDLETMTALDDTTPIDPLTLDEVADATREIGVALDASDAMGATPYVLEVSSPGVDRPLTRPRHFRRNVGRLVAVSSTSGGDLTGRIVSADTEGISLDAAPAQGAEPEPHQPPVQLPYAEISRAQVQVEFTRATGGTDREDL